MITATLRECRSVIAGLNGSRGSSRAAEPRRALIARSSSAQLPSSFPSRVQIVANLTGLLPDTAHRGFSCAADVNVSNGETVRDLFREAQIARLAGYCYEDFDALKENVASEGLEVKHCGDTFFTRWYCCTGQISGSIPGDDTVDLSMETVPGAADTLHVFFRGVMWRNPEVETARVWQKLSQSWGVPVNATDQSDGLVAHSGILNMAQELYTEMKPLLLKHSGPIRISGHSLGGTLALLVASQFILAGEIDPMRLQLHAFGSPPALSHTSCSADVSSNCGAAVRQRLGLPATNVRNWVLDFDPVPRATTAANPYLQVARRNEVFRSMYDLAGMAATAFGVAHPAQRFFFRHVGHVFMLTHTDPAADSGIRKLPEASADEELAQAPVVGRGEGFRPRAIARELLRSVLDHTHTSYGHDLLVTAKRALQQYGIDGVVGSASAPAPLPSLEPLGGSAPLGSSGLARGPLQRRSVSSRVSIGSPDIAQWPQRRSLATHTDPGAGASGDGIAPPDSGKEQSAVAESAEPDAAIAAGSRGPAHVLALAKHRVAGVRIKNGVVWRPESGAQASVRPVGKSTVFAHRRQDWAPLEVAENVSCKENGPRANGEILNDVLPLRAAAEKSSVRGTRGRVLKSDRREQGLDLDVL